MTFVAYCSVVCPRETGNAQDGSKLFMAATSAYLRQLADIGLVRRERSGRLVNYYPDFSQTSFEVREIAELIMRRLRLESGDLSFTPNNVGAICCGWRTRYAVTGEKAVLGAR